MTMWTFIPPTDAERLMRQMRLTYPGRWFQFTNEGAVCVRMEDAAGPGKSLGVDLDAALGEVLAGLHVLFVAS